MLLDSYLYYLPAQNGAYSCNKAFIGLSFRTMN